ncbi:8356_t:CDS:1, partial [Ambispora gerdemannii]
GGATTSEITKNHPEHYILYYSGVDRLIGIIANEKVVLPIKLIIGLYYGDPGCEKTTYCRDNYLNAFYRLVDG